jgi:predicted DNA-binding transcriptional regulator AlpA
MSEKLVEIPSLDALAADPGLVQKLPGPIVQHILIQVTSLLPLLVSRSHILPTEAHGEDRLLGIDEAASVLGKSKDWMYRHAESLPFTVREGRLVSFSNNGIQKYIRARLRQG